jgi:hypothetical protein
VSKKIGLLGLMLGVIIICVNVQSAYVVAWESQNTGKYRVQVPHVVLPETIQYKPYTNGGHVNTLQHPATYTAFPSYSLPESMEFRTINNLYYPITPFSQAGTASGTLAKVNADNQIIPTSQKIAKPDTPDPQQAFDVPKFEVPEFATTSPQEFEPIYLTKLNETKNPIRQVSDNIPSDSSLIENSSDDFDTPVNSIVFLKSQRVGVSDYFDDDVVPSRLSLTMSRQADWLERESLFVKPVTFTEVAPPTQLGLMQPNTGFQQAPMLPAYSQLCQQNYHYGQQQFPPNPYGGMFTGQQIPAQSRNFQSLSQLGSIMPAMSGQPQMQMPGYGMAMQQPLQAAMQSPMPGHAGVMQQQTIGYILLYPQAAQSGVNMQLAGQQGQGNDGAQPPGSEETADSNAPNLNAMQFQATFIPASQMSPFAGQPAMPQMPMANPMMMGGMNPYMMNPMMMGGMNPYMMNPMMMGGMNPYMMNPMMMGGMNPYMMNPMMMGMGGMMPPIIIQMPAADSGRRRGLFARLRAAREESQNRTQQAAGSLSSLFAQPGQMPQGQMPAKAAYPYGYFGVTASPYQSGNFGGYNDMSTQTVRYPGM